MLDLPGSKLDKDSAWRCNMVAPTSASCLRRAEPELIQASRTYTGHVAGNPNSAPTAAGISASPFPAPLLPVLPQTGASSHKKHGGPHAEHPTAAAGRPPACFLAGGQSRSTPCPAVFGFQTKRALAPPNGSTALAAARLGRCTESTDSVRALRRCSPSVPSPQGKASHHRGTRPLS